MPDPGALSIPDQSTVAEPNRDRSHDETMDAFRPQLAGVAIASAETVDFAHAQHLQAATPFDTPQVESSLPSEGDFEEVTPHSFLLDDGASGLPEEIDSEGEGTLILPPGVMDAALAPSVQQVSTPNHTPPPPAPRDASGGKPRRPRRRRPLTGRGSGG